MVIRRSMFVLYVSLIIGAVVACVLAVIALFALVLRIVFG